MNLNFKLRSEQMLMRSYLPNRKIRSFSSIKQCYNNVLQWSRPIHNSTHLLWQVCVNVLKKLYFHQLNLNRTQSYRRLMRCYINLLKLFTSKWMRAPVDVIKRRIHVNYFYGIQALAQGHPYTYAVWLSVLRLNNGISSHFQLLKGKWRRKRREYAEAFS